jgi:hypothetical protein
MANVTNKSIQLVKATLADVKGKEYDITKICVAFAYYEDIFSPFVTAVLHVVDSGMNLIGNLPIQGGEKVYVKIKDVRNTTHEYELHVWKIYDRQFTKSVQEYNLALISKEGLYNEGVRITEKLSGLPDKIVKDIMTKYLNTKKKVDVETAKYNINFYPNGKKAHSIIQTIQYKSVPKNSTPSKGKSKDSKRTGSKSSIPTNTDVASGTAGYLFFENKDGFVFKSMDLLCSDGTDTFKGAPPVATYTYKPTLNQADQSNYFVIEEYTFTDELDMVDQMRNGIYSTYMVFYNYSTGAYEEYTFNLADTFNAMSHLGSQTKLPQFQNDLSQYPTRIMSMILDHETWFDGEGPGSNEEKDRGKNNTTGGSNFPDYQKYYVSQGIARRYLMENQKMEIIIPGNMSLKVGDKIKILIPNMASESNRSTQQYDEENSGTYLISKLSHNNMFLNTFNCSTKLELIRDTYGIKDYPSKVK